MTRRAGALQRANARGPATSVSPQSDRTGRGNPLPRCTRVAHATLRISKIPAHGAALSDMGYEPFQIETGADTPQTTPRKLALLPSSPLGLFGSRWEQLPG